MNTDFFLKEISQKRLGATYDQNSRGLDQTAGNSCLMTIRSSNIQNYDSAEQRDLRAVPDVMVIIVPLWSFAIWALGNPFIYNGLPSTSQTFDHHLQTSVIASPESQPPAKRTPSGLLGRAKKGLP